MKPGVLGVFVLSVDARKQVDAAPAQTAARIEQENNAAATGGIQHNTRMSGDTVAADVVLLSATLHPYIHIMPPPTAAAAAAAATAVASS